MVSHFGMNPVRGGRPPRDNIEMGISSNIVDESLFRLKVDKLNFINSKNTGVISSV